MSRRKKHQEESFETADGFQIEDMEGNAITDEEKEEDEYFNSVAEENNWEEGYDY